MRQIVIVGEEEVAGREVHLGSLQHAWQESYRCRILFSLQSLWNILRLDTVWCRFLVTWEFV
jgi:hypothetical protein